MLRLLNKTIELSAASARNAKGNGVCMLLGLLVRGEGRRLTSAIFDADFFLIFLFARDNDELGPQQGKKNTRRTAS